MDDIIIREKKAAQRVPLNCVVRTAAGERRMRVLKVKAGQCCPLCGARKSDKVK